MRFGGCKLLMCVWLLSVTTLAAQPPQAGPDNHADTHGDRAEAVIAGDYFGAGASGGPETPVEGDAFISGGEVSLHSPVAGDAVLTGGTIEVHARVGSDLYAAGGDILVADAVGHNARLAGRRVDVEPSANIAGRMTIAGSRISVQGRVGGALTVFGDSVFIDGEVNGGAAVAARRLTVGPNARIDGRLTYRTAQPPQISPQAIITGGTRQTRLEFPGERFGPFAKAAIWAGMVMFTSGLFLMGMLIVVVAPRASASVSHQFRARPVASLLSGLALNIGIPLAATLAMITVIGIPLGLMLLFFWPVLIVLGYLFGAIVLGDSLAALFAGAGAGARGAGVGSRVLALAIVLLALMALSQLILIGAPAILLILLCGTGALMIAIRNSLR